MAESKFLKWQDKNGDMLPDECPDFPKAPDVCLNCSPNPVAPVPDWRTKNQHDPFLNQKLCVYHITYVTPETTTGYEDGMTPEEEEEALNAIWEKYEDDAIELLLDFYEKDTSEETIEEVKKVIERTQYDLLPNPGSRLKLLYTVDFDTIFNLPEYKEEEEEEEEEPGDIVVDYDSHEMLMANIRVRKGLALHSRYLKVFRAVEGGNLKYLDDNRLFNLEDYGDTAIFFSEGLLKDAMNQLDSWLNDKGYNIANTGGFWGFLEEKVIKLQFTFTGKYYLKKLKIWTEACAEKPKVYPKRRLRGLRKKSAWRDKTAVAFFAQMSEMSADLSARVEPSWLEFLQKYTYPEIYSTKAQGFEEPGERTIPGCIADALGNELKELGQDILDEAFSIGDAIAYAFHKNLCRFNVDEVSADNVDIGYNFGVPPVDENTKFMALAQMQAFKELDKRDQVFANFCMQMLSFRTTGSPLQILDSMWAEGFERIKICGLLDLMLDAIQCLFKGLSLEEALASMIRSALKAMGIDDFGELFIGLPPEKQAELDALVKKKLESGDIFKEGSSGQRASDAIANKEATGDAPFMGKMTVTRPWENKELLEKQKDFKRDNSQNNQVATKAPLAGGEYDATRRSLAQSMDVYNTSKNQLDPNVVMDAYILALLEVFSDNLLGLLDMLNKFPGAQIVSMIISTMDCPRPALFNPSIMDFIKSIAFPFCRNQNEITLIRLENPFMYIPKLKDILRLILEIMKRLLIQLVIKIIILIIVKICEIIGNAICKALETVGNVAASLPDLLTGRKNLFDVIKESICGPDADDSVVNEAVVQLIADLGVGGQALADPERALTFAEDLSASSTRGELLNAMLGEPSTTFLSVADQIVENEYPDYRDALPNETSIKRFFTNVGNLVPTKAKAEFRMALDMFPDDIDLPANPSLCATPEQIKDFESLRCDLLEGRASPEQCEKMFENYRGTLLDDLDDLGTIMQKGFGNAVSEALPPIFSDPGCNNGMLPFEPEEAIATATGALKADADKMRMAYSEDMLGNGGFFTGQDSWGFMNMVLSDTIAFPYTAHTRYTASDKAAVDFYINPGDADAVDAGSASGMDLTFWLPDPAPLAQQEGAYPYYIAEYLLYQFYKASGNDTSVLSYQSGIATDLAGGTDNGESSFKFVSTNNIKGKKRFRRSFDDLGFIDFLGFTNVDLLATPDYGYNTSLKVDFNSQYVKVTQHPRKKTPDIMLLFKDNAKGFRNGPNGGQSVWEYGFKIKAFFSDIERITLRGESAVTRITEMPEVLEDYEKVVHGKSTEVTYDANRPDDNIRVYVTEMFNEGADYFKWFDFIPIVNARVLNEPADDPKIGRWRKYEWLAVDNALDEVDLLQYPSFMENSQRLVSVPPQVNMMYDLFNKEQGKEALKTAYDDFMQVLFTHVAGRISGDTLATPGPHEPSYDPPVRKAWRYGAIFDDLTNSDFDYMVKKSDIDGYIEDESDAGCATDAKGRKWCKYYHAMIYEYDDDGNRDDEHSISESDNIMGSSRMHVVETPDRPNRIIYLDPNKYGGKYMSPPFHLVPKASPGWKGIVDVLFPDLRPCKPHMTEAVDFQEVKDKIDQVYPRIPSDHRLKHSEECKLEVPYNRILERSGRAGLMGIIMSLIKIYASTHFLKSIATFTAFAPKFPDNYSNLYAGYIAERMEDSMTDPTSSWFNTFKDSEFWYAFLEQAVQMYAWRVDDGDIEHDDVPVAVQEALARLNDLQEDYRYPFRDDLDRAKARDDAGEFQGLESYRTDKNLEAVKATDDDAKLVLMELIKEQLNIVGATFTKNLSKAGMAPETYDLYYYFMGEFADGSTLDLDKEVVQIAVGLPTLEEDGMGPHYTNGNEFSVMDGSTYVGYYHIYIYPEADETMNIDAGQEVYMVGEQHSDDEHELLRPFANKQALAGKDGSPIGGVPPYGEASGTPEKPFVIEKWVKAPNKMSPSAAKSHILGLGSGNISDYYPGDMKLVKDDTGRVVGVEGSLGVTYGLDFSMAVNGSKQFITSVEISALDIPVSAMPEPLDDNSVLLHCLLEKLKKDERYILFVDYIFSFKKVTALMAVYNDMGFLPSIGEATVKEGATFKQESWLGFDEDSKAGKWINDGGTKPGGYVNIEYEPEDPDEDDIVTINQAWVDYNMGWVDKWSRTPLIGNPFVLKYDEWDQLLLRNSNRMAKKIFRAHYNSRDFGVADSSDGPSQWLAQLKERFTLKPPGWLSSSRRAKMRSSPFNANGDICDKNN